MISVASLKSEAGNAPYFKLDDGTTLWPAAGYINTSVLRDNQRVLLNYTLLGDSTTGAVGYDYYIRVNGLDTLLTKPVVESLGIKNDSVYGKDPVNIKSMWTGNGHLTINFEADFGNQSKHLVNLIETDPEQTPYVLEFRQNAFDDPRITRAQGIVCFDLSRLPVADDQNVTLTIRAITFEGTKGYSVEYNPNEEKSAGNTSSINLSNLGKVN